MQIVILAAGRGTRMGKLTDSQPKPMIPISGKPLLARKIEALPAEVEEVIIVIGYLGEQIRKYFGDFFSGKKISYAVDESMDGSGGALHAAKDTVKDEFLVMMGDDLYAREDVRKMMDCDLGIAGLEMDNPKQFGTITADEKGFLVEVVEKKDAPGRALANTGLYKLNRKFFEYPLVPIGKGEFGLPQTLALMARDWPIRVEKATAWLPIGNPDDLKEAEKVIDRFI